MRAFSLALLAASVIGVASMGSASAMPFGPLASPLENAVQEVAMRCDRSGRCYQTQRGQRSHHRHGHSNHRAHGRPAYSNGHRGNHYGRAHGPRVGIGIGPVGVDVRSR